MVLLIKKLQMINKKVSEQSQQIEKLKDQIKNLQEKLNSINQQQINANIENEVKYNQQSKEITKLTNLFNDFNQKLAKKCEEQEKNNIRLDAQANLINKIDEKIIQLTDELNKQKDNTKLQIENILNENKGMKSEQQNINNMLKQDLGIYFYFDIKQLFQQYNTYKSYVCLSANKHKPNNCLIDEIKEKALQGKHSIFFLQFSK